MRAYFYTILIFSFTCSFAQVKNTGELVQLENTSWYIQGSNWNAEEFTVSSKDYFQLSTKLGKIDATKNVYYKINSTLPIEISGVSTKQFLVRQDSSSGKLFVRSFMDDKKEFLLYDFNLKVGDTIQSLLTLNLKQDLIVTEINMIDFKGVSRKQITAHIGGDRERRSYKFIAGVGSAYGFIVDLNTQRETVTVLKCYSSKQGTLYDNGLCKSPPTRQRPTRAPRTVIDSK